MNIKVRRPNLETLNKEVDAFLPQRNDNRPPLIGISANRKEGQSCSNYLASELKRFGAKVYQQDAVLTAYNGKQLQSCNIIGSFNPENSRRILLFAHWDTRPFSDEDANPDNFRKPIDGADDGASGVGVLLEIARQLGMKNPNIGIDIAFFDAEDYGVAKFEREKYNDTNET